MTQRLSPARAGAAELSEEEDESSDELDALDDESSDPAAAQNFDMVAAGVADGAGGGGAGGLRYDAVFGRHVSVVLCLIHRVSLSLCGLALCVALAARLSRQEILAAARRI